MTKSIGTEFFKYLAGNSTDNAVASFNAPTFMNSVIDVANSKSKGETVEKATKLGLEVLLSFVGQNAKGAAEAQCLQNEAAVDTTQKELNTISQNTIDKLQPQIDEIKANIEMILENIQKAEETEEERKEKEEKVKVEAENLANAENILNTPDATTEERMNAISLIMQAGENIKALLEETQALSSELTDLNKSTEKLTKANTKLNSSSIADIENSNRAVQEAAQKVTQQQTENITTNATAIANEGVSTQAAIAAAEMEVAAKGAGAIPVVGALASGATEAVAQKLKGVSTDFGGAAMTRFSSFANITSQLATSTGLIQTNYSDFANFTNTIGGLFDNTTNYSNNYYSITGELGTWFENFNSTLQTTNETISTAMETYSIENENENEEDDNKKPANVDLGAEELKKVVK